jgi:PLP dependent protein
VNVAENFKHIQVKIAEACERVNRNIEDVKIIAVTKYVSIERTIEALEAGISNIGENRDEGLTAKWEVLKDKPVWHFIGSLQTRKVKNIIDKVDYIHSLDRLSLAEEINKRANRKIKCFIQVNVSGEESKHGLVPEELEGFILSLKDLKNIEVSGLMTMAPLTEDRALLHQCFRKLKQLQLDVQQMKLTYAPCSELSMGMSNDFEVAIEEGATMIRIGTALVGQEV